MDILYICIDLAYIYILYIYYIYYIYILYIYMYTYIYIYIYIYIFQSFIEIDIRSSNIVLGLVLIFVETVIYNILHLFPF